MLFDSHAHINYEEYKEIEREAVIDAIEKSEVAYVMDIGVDLASSALTCQHVKRLPWCYGAVGFHPHNAKDMGDTELLMIKSLAKKDKIKAIGEIGLDFHYDYSQRDVQREAFRRQIRLANELKMPIVIHAREADQEVMNILKEENAFSEERKGWFPKRQLPEAQQQGHWDSAAKDARVLLHCFSGSKEIGMQYIKLGATLSIAGPVTYKNNKKTVSVVEAIPIEFLLIETDSPFLTPEPLRGKKNLSLYVVHTAKKIAEIKGISLNKVAEQTMNNAKTFFAIQE